MNDPKDKQAIEDAKKDFQEWVSAQEGADGQDNISTFVPGL